MVQSIVINPAPQFCVLIHGIMQERTCGRIGADTCKKTALIKKKISMTFSKLGVI